MNKIKVPNGLKKPIVVPVNMSIDFNKEEKEEITSFGQKVALFLIPWQDDCVMKDNKIIITRTKSLCDKIYKTKVCTYTFSK